MTTPSSAAPRIAEPGAAFNFSQHLIDCNAARPAKAACIDDAGTLRYGELAERIRRLAAALLASGIRREERVLLLMHDCSDWPVGFLGAMHAGIVPVAVNTLLRAEDYAFMLEHSRAQAMLVSGALLPLLHEAMIAAIHEVKMLIVSHSVGELPAGAVALDTLIAQHPPMAPPAATCPDDPGFWLYSSGSTGRPKGTLHTQVNPYWTAELYGKPVLGLTECDVCFSAAKLFFAYGLGNALSFPLSMGATVVLMAERPTPAATFKRWMDHQPTVFFGAPTGFAGMLAAPGVFGRRGLAGRSGQALHGALWH